MAILTQLTSCSPEGADSHSSDLKLIPLDNNRTASSDLTGTNDLPVNETEDENTPPNTGSGSSTNPRPSSNLQVVAEGTGFFRGATPLPSDQNSVHFFMEGQFLRADSEIIVSLFHESFDNDNGIQLVLTLTPEDKSIHFHFAEPNRPAFELLQMTEALNRDLRFSIRFEIVRSPATGMRVLIWNNWVDFNNGGRSNRRTITAGNANFDSSRTRYNFYENFGGLGWGVYLKFTRITLLRREAPYGIF